MHCGLAGMERGGVQIFSGVCRMERDFASADDGDLARQADLLLKLLARQGVVLKGGGRGEELMTLRDGDHAGCAVTRVASKGDGGVSRGGVLKEIDQGGGGEEGVGFVEDGEDRHGGVHRVGGSWEERIGSNSRVRHSD